MSSLKESFSYIRSSKFYILTVISIFLLSSIFGFFFPMFEEEILRIISELKMLFDGLNLWQTISLIFFNNARASLVAILTGIFFGVIPLTIALFNGYLVGFISRIVTNEYSFIEMWRLLPHGIFELPAVLISIGLGLRIGIETLTKPTKKNFIHNLDNTLKTFVLIIIPLLVLAAIIEGLLIFYL